MVSALYTSLAVYCFSRHLDGLDFSKMASTVCSMRGAALDNLLSIINMIPKLTFYVIFLLFTVFTGLNRVRNFDI